MAFSVPVGRENSGKDYCIMHVRSRVQGKLTTFTHASWCKCLNCASRWMKLDCKDGEIATKSASDLGLASDCIIEYGGDAHRCTHYTYRSSCRFQQSTGFIENVIWNSATFKWLHVKGRDKKNMMRKTNTACWTWTCKYYYILLFSLARHDYHACMSVTISYCTDHPIMHVNSISFWYLCSVRDHWHCHYHLCPWYSARVTFDACMFAVCSIMHALLHK
jgi:hypothetical protein